MSSKDPQYSDKLLMLYSLKLEQLMRARASANTFRFLVLQAEAEAINQELKQLGMSKLSGYE